MAHAKLKEEMAGHIASLRRYALVLTRSRDEAEDLVQECLSRAIAGAGTFREGSDMRAWLFRILHNVHVNTIRRRHVEQAARADMATAESVAEATQHRHLEVREVMAALAQLPEDQRRALSLIAADEMRYEEAAKRLGIPLGTFMSRLARGRAALRAALNQPRQPKLRVIGRSE